MTAATPQGQDIREPNVLYRVPDLYEIAFSWDPATETEFYSRVLRLNGLRRGSARPVVEFGSGTGRILRMITALGFKCVGIDLSSPMVRYARRKCRRVPDLIVGDMAKPPVRSGVFAGALSTLASINYLPSMNVVRSHLLATSRALVGNGVYVIDFMVGIPRKRRESWEVRRRGALYQVDWRIIRVETRKDKMHERIRIAINGGPVLVHNSQMTIISQEDFSRAARNSGFVEQQWYRPFERSPTGEPPLDGRAVAILKKGS